MASVLAILFDADGVLVDSEPIVSRVLSEMLTENGLPISAEEAEGVFTGSHISVTVAQVEARLGRPLPADFIPEFRRRSIEAFQGVIRPVDGIEDALNALDGLPRAVVSNGPQEKMAVTLSLTGLARYFENRLIFSAYDIGAWKPDPALFLHAATTLAVAPAECVVIEDSPLGLQAARAIGMRAFAYEPDGKRIDDPHGAQRFRSMLDLPELIHSL